MSEKPDSNKSKSTTLVDVVQDLSDRNQRPVLIFVQNRGSITDENTRELRGLLLGKTFDQLDVLIHSLGGDPHAAYMLAEVIRFHAKTVRVLVPGIAASAATLMCLCACEIVMDEIATLGPLDVQIREIVGGVRHQNSALNPFKSLEHLRNFSLETLTTAAVVIGSGFSLKPDEVLPVATTFASGITTPLLAQIDPGRLGDFVRSLSIADKYAERLLTRYSSLPPKAIEKLVRTLVYEYPSHSYQINHREASELGLPVKLADGPDVDTFTQLLGFLDDRALKDLCTLIEPKPAASSPEQGGASSGSLSTSEGAEHLGNGGGPLKSAPRPSEESSGSAVSQGTESDADSNTGMDGTLGAIQPTATRTAGFKP